MARRSHYELDLLKRFLPAPYLFDMEGPGDSVHIASNDLEIALALRGRHLAQPSSDILHWTIMRDRDAKPGEDEVTLVAGGDLRTLFVGSEVILFLDRGQRKLLGFVGWIDVDYVISVLLPLLFEE